MQHPCALGPAQEQHPHPHLRRYQVKALCVWPMPIFEHPLSVNAKIPQLGHTCRILIAECLSDELREIVMYVYLQ